MTTIELIDAHEILDSRGNPTLEAVVVLDSGAVGRAAVPSGASTGAHEAVELRDGEKDRYGGKGVRKAVINVIETIAPALLDQDASEQAADRPAADRSRRHAQQGQAGRQRDPGRVARLRPCRRPRRTGCRSTATWAACAPTRCPCPCSTSSTAASTPRTPPTSRNSWSCPSGHRLTARPCAPARRSSTRSRRSCTSSGFATGQGDEGGFAPSLASNQAAIEAVLKAIELAGYHPGEDVAIALDPAVSELVDLDTPADSNGELTYRLAKEGRTLKTGELIAFWEDWVARYPIVSLEDGLAEDDWAGWHDAELAPRREGPAGRRRPAGHQPGARPARHRRGRGQRRARQAQPDRHADRDADHDRSGGASTAGARSSAIAAARRRTRRSPTLPSPRAWASSSAARRRAPSASPSTTGCCASRPSWARPRDLPGRGGARALALTRIAIGSRQ